MDITTKLAVSAASQTGAAPADASITDLMGGSNAAAARTLLGVSANGVGGVTAVAGAATLNKPAGTVTSEALVSASSYTLTLSNSLIKAGSTVIVDQITSAGASSGTLLFSKAVSDGQVVIGIAISPSLTGTVIIDFAVFN